LQRIKSTFSAPLLVLAVYALLITSRYINVSVLQTKDNVYLSLIILQVLIFVLPGIFYCRLRGYSIPQKLRFKLLSPSKIWFVFSCFGVLIFGGTLLNTAVFYIFGNEAQYSLYNTFAPSGEASLKNITYIILAFAVLPALTEEFMFRGIVLSEYSEYGVSTAILMSGIMFAMVHFNLNQFLIYFYCGVITAYAVYITRSLLAAVMLHFFNNIYAIFFESMLWDVIKAPNSIVFFLFVIATLFMIFLVLSFNSAENILYDSGIKGEQSPPEATKREGGIKLWFEALLSPSFLACVIIFLVDTLIL